jgi:hypothetical protein
LFAELPARVTRTSTKAGLYAIFDELDKETRQNLKEPLKIVRYTGTLTNQDIQCRFIEHCTPNGNKKRFEFDPKKHRIELIYEWDIDNLDERFDTPGKAAIAFELLSLTLREAFSPVQQWSPGNFNFVKH